MIILYNAPRSSASRRVRLCLEEKGLRYDNRVVDMERLEHHSPEYLRINPNGVVPTMVHDGRPLHESGTICEYLDEISPDPPLRPAAPYDRALMRNWIRHIDERIHNLIVFNWRHAFGDIASKWTDAQLDAVLARIPSKERRESWLRVARRPYTEEERAEARGKLVELLGRMEAALAASGLARRGRVLARRHRRRPFRQAHRGGDRPRTRSQHGAHPPRGGMVGPHPGAARLPRADIRPFAD